MDLSQDQSDSSNSATAAADAAISDNATASAYQDAIDRARTDRVVATQTKVAIADNVSNLKNSRDNLVEIFKAAAVVAYPGIGAVLASRNLLMNLPAEHPVQQLWSQYGQKIDAIDSKIAIQTDKFAQATVNETAAQGKIDAVSADYEIFAADAVSSLPPASTLSPELPSTPPMSSPADNADLFSQVIGMQYIHPSVQKWIFFSYRKCQDPSGSPPSGSPPSGAATAPAQVTTVDTSMAVQNTAGAASTLNPSVQLATTGPTATMSLPGIQAPQVSIPGVPVLTVPTATFLPRPVTPGQQLAVAGGLLVALLYLFSGSKS
jgi:hypothetical protein